MSELYQFSRRSIFTAGVTLVLGFITFFAVFTVRRLAFHPLSRYPGPTLWKLSRVPYMLSFRNGRLAHNIKAIHQQYGDIVRIAPNELSFINPDAVRDIYVKRPNQIHRTLPKDPVRFPPPQPGTPVSILDALDDDHARIRKAWSLSFSTQALSAQEPLVRSYVLKLVKGLQSQVTDATSSVVDLQEWISFCTFDIIGALSFGEDFGCLDNSRYHDWVASLVFSIKGKVQIAACRWYPWIYQILLKWSLSPEALQAMAKGRQMAREKVQRRLLNSSNHPDFLFHLEKSRQELSEAEIEVNAATMIFAGSHTLQSAITGVFFLLLQNPSCLKTVTGEVRAAFESLEDMNSRRLSNLQYLQAVIQESLRIVSPVPLNMTRMVPEGGAMICGHMLPKGTIVGYMPWAANMSTRNFTEPETFLPERWLSPDKQTTARGRDAYEKDERSANATFLAGPRDCIGQNLARMEMMYVIASLLFYFDISWQEDSFTRLKRWDDQDTYAVWMKTPLEVRLKVAEGRSG